MKKAIFYCFLIVSISASSSKYQNNDNWYQTHLDFGEGSESVVWYQDNDGWAVMEGDIILGTSVEAETWWESYKNPKYTKDNKAIIHSFGERRWPHNTIPFRVSNSFSNAQRNDIFDAIAHWEENTFIEFIPVTEENADEFPDVVNFALANEGCRSDVGRRGLYQYIMISPGCSLGNIIHEIGHTVGLWHEQSREDRDEFVSILFENIIEDRVHNFDQQIVNGIDVGPYDYGSIMHYSANAFGINGAQTIIPLQVIPPGIVMGQRNGLSALDITAINQFYPAIKPVAVLHTDTNLVFKYRNIKLDAQDSYDPQNEPLQYHWDLDNGFFETTLSPVYEHLFLSRGQFHVGLAVTDVDGYSDHTMVEINVIGLEEIVPMMHNIL